MHSPALPIGTLPRLKNPRKSRFSWHPPAGEGIVPSPSVCKDGEYMPCKKCGADLIGKQVSYCSQRCSKLHLKSLYRKRNRASISEYNKTYKRALATRPLSAKAIVEIRSSLGGKCERCLSKENLHIHHLRPLFFGGANHKSNLMLLCAKCHGLWHKLVKPFFAG
jgi:5-methylcytosine-specific restriction endonuclease McrA